MVFWIWTVHIGFAGNLSCLFVLYTGSNSHNNGQPAGDGQAGDDGEGNAG